MIQTLRHKGRAKFYETGSVAGIQPSHANRLRLLLAALDTSVYIQDVDIPGFRLHRLKGKASGRWSVRVSGNWRLTFECREGQAHIIGYEDYH